MKQLLSVCVANDGRVGAESNEELRRKGSKLTVRRDRSRLD